MADQFYRHARVQQECRDWPCSDLRHTFTCGLMGTKIKFIIQHTKKPERKSAPWKFKRFWPNPIFFLHISVGFSSTWPAVHPTCCPTTQHSPSKSPLHLSSDRQFSRWKQFPACSSLQLISKQPCLHFPRVMRPPWSWSTTRTSRQGWCQVLRSGDCYMPSTWSRKNYSKPGPKPGINPAYIHSSFLPYLRDGKTPRQDPAPFPQPSLPWQQDSLHELAMACTAKELQDRAFNCLKIHYPPIVT